MSVVITTDASKKGFGGFMNEQIFQGNWMHAQSKRHINCLDMEAVFLTMKIGCYDYRRFWKLKRLAFQRVR
jgi:hypothetical protein